MLDLTAQVVCARLAGPGNVPAADLPEFIRKVAATFGDLAEVDLPSAVVTRKKPSTAPVKSDEQPNGFLRCKECGMQLKMLKRHLLTVHEMTPDAYREKHHLSADARMVTSNYAELRSKLAKKHGLGKKRDLRS